MKLSLLSAVRDEGLYIRQMIESALSQSHEDWELLFVDDGSSDETVAIIEEFAERDDRVRLVEAQDAKGKVSAFNKAFAASTGDVICIQGGDDLIPEGAFAARVAPFSESPQGKVALFKLRTFSEDPKFDGMVLPKGESSSRSGGSLTMWRDLADRVFPIPESLVAEDIWLSNALDAVAATTVSRSDIVLDYRIHDGNSNPRNKPFHVMTEASHLRHMAYEELLRADELPLRPDQERLFRTRLKIEHFRYEGPAWRILTVGEATWPDRLASLSRAHPALFALRKRFYRALSGLRGA
ncbi:glycosyltransferase family 2 protein [Janibacter hoylei]|uniref:glycosyltransferase family 2 protein n=1 Tax=Janibacter hoylei TaxID=364298 RepID=UPI0021A7BA90|nr:glycosyltransferase family 2 protein [Janibacter hoylei]MCT1619088.1 glycosyltransferase [Janibacter hoylei]MCT2293894.1 glycosyltransferase [Janibacter hoylei]